MQIRSKGLNAGMATSIPIPGCELKGDLFVPDFASGLVVFAHGSGSSRQSPRNQHVAGMLNQVGMGTLLTDLLTPEEEQLDLRTRELRFNIELLGDRLVKIIEWLVVNSQTGGLNIGFFGASTGAAAAIMAATRRPKWVKAVVCRGGRPDLAGDALAQLQVPTLLIVGSLDYQVLELNQEALTLMPCLKNLDIVPGATHLFEEPGTLDQAAKLARDWFEKYLL